MTRERKINPGELVLSLLRCFSTNQVHEIAGLHRSFIQDSQSKVSYSSFYAQLSKSSFEDFSIELYRHIYGTLYLEEHQRLAWLFEKWQDILLQDGSSWGIHACLSEIYPGRFTKTAPAAIEMHALYSLKRQGYVEMAIAADSISEHVFIPNPDEMNCSGKLFLLDAGYHNIPKLEKLGQVGGHYVVRARANSNPLIDILYGGSSWQQRQLVGKKLKDIPLKRGKDYDFRVTTRASDGQDYTLRLAAIWNRQDKEHVLFLTNIPVSIATLKDIGRLYRLRWQIELSFKELKSYTGLKRFLTANEHTVFGFAVLALCAMQIRRFIVLAAETLNPQVRLSLHKAAISAAEFMPQILRCLLRNSDGLKQVLLEIFYFLEATMTFSNPKRATAFELCVLEPQLNRSLSLDLAA